MPGAHRSRPCCSRCFYFKKVVILSKIRIDVEAEIPLRLRYLDALPRGRLNREWHPVTTFPLCFFAAHPLRKLVFDGLAIKKAPQLRCDAIP